ncbi:MAG TPA: hypothetical protein VNU47_02025 [Candidatus Paceibacterota bacterium]|nr:hypothetical protein [Candidatus Paceibacterota bacterium]
MDELTIGDKIYISSKRAAEITGYAKDYIGQLCREGRVNATLVGRSWYVLESSLRAHRFGGSEDVQASEKEQVEEKELTNTWNVPIYKAEETPSVPPLAPRVSVNALETHPVASKEGVEAPEDIKDMQSAWKEWFASRQKVESPEEEIVNEPVEEEEIIHESGDSIDEEPDSAEVVDIPMQERGENVATHTVYEEDTQPVQIHKSGPTSQINEENVPIRRAYDIPVTAPMSTFAAEEGIIRSEVVRKKTKATVKKQRTGLVTKALLISVAGLAIAISVIGSGAADHLIGSEGVYSSVIRFINGTTVIDK